jgi:hypothetical protein
VVFRAGVMTSVGFGTDRPEAALRSALSTPEQGLELPGVGHCHVVIGSLGGVDDGYLLLARPTTNSPRRRPA